MFFQITWVWEALVTFGALVWFLSCVGSVVSLQSICRSSCNTFSTLEWYSYLTYLFIIYNVNHSVEGIQATLVCQTYAKNLQFSENIWNRVILFQVYFQWQWYVEFLKAVLCEPLDAVWIWHPAVAPLEVVAKRQNYIWPSFCCCSVWRAAHMCGTFQGGRMMYKIVADAFWIWRPSVAPLGVAAKRETTKV